MPRGSRNRSRTDNMRLVGVRRIDAEPEDIATAIFDIALQDQENARALAPIPPQIPTMGGKGRGKIGKGTGTKDKIDKDDEKDEENEE